MNPVIITKFGGSTIGVDGISIPVIIQRINSISKNAKVVAVLADRQDVRDKSSEVITKLKADLLARKDPDDWTNFEIWDSAYVEHSGNVTVHAALGKGFVGLSDAQLMEKAKTIHDIEDPGRTS